MKSRSRRAQPRAQIAGLAAVGWLWLVTIGANGLAVTVDAQIPVRNASFESGLSAPWGTGQYSRGRPTWWTSGNCRARAEADSKIQKHGRQSLHITNPSPRAAGVYGTTQQPIAVLPGRQYRISLWARARNLASDGAVSIVVDADWKVRPIQLQKGTYEWTEFSGTFSPRENTAQVRILSEDVGEVWLDDIRIGSVADNRTGSDRDFISTWVSPVAGGRIRCKDGEILIPARATKKSFQLKVSRGALDEPTLDPNLRVLDVRLVAEAAARIKLTAPAGVTLSFSSKLPEGVDAKRLYPVVHNGKFWRKIPSAKVDPVRETVSFKTSRLGHFAIALDEEETLFWLRHETADKPLFRVEYVRGQEAALEPESLDVILATLQRCHDVFVVGMGYPPPPYPITVKLRDLSVPEIKKRLGDVLGVACVAGLDVALVGDEGQILISSHIRDAQTLRIAVVHEYFHLLQGATVISNGIRPDCVARVKHGFQWLTEASAVWAEDVVFDDANQYVGYIVAEPDYTMHGIIRSSSDGTSKMHPYAGSAFLKFLGWRYGNRIILTAWKLARAEVELSSGKTIEPDTTYDVLRLACANTKTRSGTTTDFRTNVSDFALQFNFLRTFGEAPAWFRGKTHSWLNKPGLRKISLKSTPKGTLPLGQVAAFGTGKMPWLKPGPDLRKLNVSLRIPEKDRDACAGARLSMGTSAALLVVVFSNAKTITAVHPLRGDGGTIDVPARASHIVVIPLNMEPRLDLPLELLWRAGTSEVLKLAGSVLRGPKEQDLGFRATWFSCPNLTLTIHEPDTIFRPVTGRCRGKAFARPYPDRLISFSTDLATEKGDGTGEVGLKDNRVYVRMFGTVRIDHWKKRNIVGSTIYPAARLTLEGTLKNGTAEGKHTLRVSSIDPRDPPERTTGELLFQNPAVFQGTWKATSGGIGP